MASIFFLGFSSGLPFLLLLSTLSAWLTTCGITKTHIGLLAFVTLPYAFKFLWAPFLDRYRIPFICEILGHRRGWLVITQILLMVGLIGLGQTNPEEHLFHTTLWALMVGFCSASQDILIEAYRIETLSKNYLGYGVGASVIGYRFGMLVAGAGALYLSTYLSWAWVYGVMAGFVSIGIVTVLCSSEINVEITTFNIKKQKSSTSLSEFILNSVYSLWRREDLGLIALFIICFKVSDTIINTISIPFLIETGFTISEIAHVAKSFGIIAMIIGGFWGGIILSRMGLRKTLFWCSLLQGIACILFWVQAYIGHNILFLLVSMGIENLTCGMSQVALIAYFSNLCLKPYCGTHFALLTSLSSLDRVIISALAGWLADLLTWPHFYICIYLLSLPALLMLIRYPFHFDASSNIEKDVQIESVNQVSPVR